MGALPFPAPEPFFKNFDARQEGVAMGEGVNDREAARARTRALPLLTKVVAVTKIDAVAGNSAALVEALPLVIAWMVRVMVTKWGC